MHVFLASQSPRRRELLTQIGVAFETLDVVVDETPAANEPALDYVRRVAREKAGAGLLQVSAVGGALVLGADTEVVLDGRVFGKPADFDAQTDPLVRVEALRLRQRLLEYYAGEGRSDAVRIEFTPASR